MCLVALALAQSRRFPLVIATNRDEFFDRPATRLAWWTPPCGEAAILSGRDLDSGGTWMGLTAQGRLGLLTNIREPAAQDPEAPSRGHIIPDWLRAKGPHDRFWMRTALSGYKGFNLIAADFASGQCFWASNRGALPQRLEPGVYGLSNAGLDTPWPKVEALKGRLHGALAEAETVDDLAARLFLALADREVPADVELPSTGVPIELERALSPAFIHTADGRYGTRCATLVITEASGRQQITHVIERSFSSDGRPTLQRSVQLRGWPPQTGDGRSAIASMLEPGPVSEIDLRSETTSELVSPG